MALFAKRTQVFGPETFPIGELDLSVDGCYRNVKTFELKVKPKHDLYVEVTSDAPIDVVVAAEDQSKLGYRDQVTDARLGPYDTGKSESMGLLIGVYRGDKATVKAEAWMERR